MKQPIELRKVRDFGQTINDSFTFLKENFKPLFTALMIICGAFILINTVTVVFTYTNMLSISNPRYTPANTYYDLSSHTTAYLWSIFLTALVGVLLQFSVFLITLCYIAVYLQNQNSKPSFAEIWGFFKYYFFRTFGSTILITIMSVISFFFCVIPFFYFMPIFYLIIPIMVIENASFGYAFNKSFSLIKNNWWLVFGVIFVMSIIVAIAGSMASLPLTIIPLVGKFVTLKSFVTLPVIIIFSAVRSVLLLLYVLPTIAVALCYFNLSEEKDGFGLMNRMEKFGKTTDDGPNLPAEEY